MAEYKQVKINMSPEDYQDSTTMAKKEGITNAAYMRNFLRIDADINSTRRGSVRAANIDIASFYLMARIEYELRNIVQSIDVGKALDRQIFSTLIDMQGQLNQIIGARS